MTVQHLWMLLPPLGVNLLALGVGLRRRKTLSAPQWLLVLYLLLCLVTTLGQEVLTLLRGNNRILVHLFAPIQLLAFAWMYAAWTPKLLGRVFQAMALSYCLACLIMLPMEDLGRFDGPSFYIQNLLLLACSLTLLCRLALQVDCPLLGHPGFWIASGVLCDMAITLVFFASRDWLLVHTKSWTPWISLARAQVVAISYLFFLRALTLERTACDK